MAIFNLRSLPLLALGCLVVAGCDTPKKPTSPPEPPGGRYVIVQVDGLDPGTRETLEVDTATGSTWRLVKSTARGAHDDVGWHLVADLTIESRTPYYRSRPDLGLLSAEGGR